MTVRVLVVDDSVTMRALFSGVLEKGKDVTVVGSANGADEARAMIAEHNPDVITLDVEMPGMNGLEFLEEIMTTKPMPVIMLSTLTQKGADTSLKALELGAIDCFPKPTQMTMEEFDKIGPKLCQLVTAAARGNVQKPAPRGDDAAPVGPEPISGFEWNGNVLAMAASTGGIEALNTILRRFPDNCPPTIVTQQMDPGLASAVSKKLDAITAAKVVLAEAGTVLEPGHIYLAADPATHVVVDKWPEGSLRLLGTDPIAGSRPSANLLFGALAKTAGKATVAAILTGIGQDGVAGLAALKSIGARTLIQDPATCVVAEAVEAAQAKGAAAKVVPLDDMAQALLDSCNKLAAAA